jgi:hypothetical protein
MLERAREGWRRMTTLFLATCGIACAFYLYVLVRLRIDQVRGKTWPAARHKRLVAFPKRAQTVNDRPARQASA